MVPLFLLGVLDGNTLAASLGFGVYEFESEPILFICLDSDKRLYIRLCSEIRYKQMLHGNSGSTYCVSIHRRSVLTGLAHDYTNQSRIVIHNET